MQTKTFGAEAKQLLELMIHSVYSHKDVFLRELISNASDALDKRRFAALTNEALLDKDTPLEITVTPNTAARTLTISDNGIGMSEQEVIDNLGTIAKSGTREMLSKIKGEKNAPDLIGQFGVGFYSAFMVAIRIEVLTRKAGEAKATRWESTGDGTYGIEPAEKAEVGTTITLYLKPADEEDGMADYSQASVIEDIVRKHSDFVTHPIVLVADGKGPDSRRTVNSMKPIWSRPEKEVTEREYAEFYRHVSHDFGSPLKTIPFRAEGTFEYQALLFVPERAPFDLYYRDTKRGLQLYVRRVLIMEQCDALLPSYLRFVRGVVDSADLPLNVSRELLQENRQLAAIRKRLTKKVVDTLVTLAENDSATYEKFYTEFGPLLKEGIGSDGDNKEKLLSLLRYSSTNASTTSLGEYVKQMKEGQEAIYYISGDSRANVERSPHLEAYKANGYDVLFFVDPVDELVVANTETFEGKPLRSVSKGELDIKTDKKDDAAKAEYGDLCEHLQRALEKNVKEVRVSDRLRTSAVCLVGSEGDLSPHMERLLRQAQKELPVQKRILEVNPEHEQIRALHKRLKDKRDDELLKQYAELLYGQALLAEGSPLPEPAEFAKLVGDLVVRAERG